jgi:hypothetical protein
MLEHFISQFNPQIALERRQNERFAVPGAPHEMKINLDVTVHESVVSLVASLKCFV